MTLRSLGLGALLAFSTPLAPGAVRAETLVPAKDPADALMKTGLDAIKARSHDLFVADGTRSLRAGKPAFDRLSARFAPMLLKGYKTTLLGTLRKGDRTLHLWKLEPAGAPEDYEIRVVLRDGRVDAFTIQ
ncbi:MAG TPA: hypothetical protein VMT47_03700 [Polyangia bacterium]|nr:hypothetical protein [Polyangia bacterium]